MIRAYADRRDYNRYIGITFISVDQHQVSSIGRPIEFVEMDEDARIEQPTIQLKQDEAQELMDELWRVGFRPSEGSGSAGSLAATEKHLKDMQTLTFNMIDKILTKE